MTAQPGQAVAGRYRLNELLGVGAMGEVWRATDELLGREVALKMLRPGYGDDPTFLARFRAEARAVAPLTSPHIAQIFDYGEEPADELSPRRPFLVLEFVPGEPLSALLQRSGDGIGVQRALEVLASTADALQVAHEAGVVHRDIKPANLMVTHSGQIKVTDFGIARVTGAEALTSTGTLLGTAHYLAPEVAGGSRAGPASDIYALGAVAYECLTGTQLYPGEDPVRVAMAHVNEPPPTLPPSVPAPVAALILSCLAKDPAVRPAPARRIADEARALLAGAAGAAATMAAPVSPAASTVMLSAGQAVPPAAGASARSEGGKRRRGGETGGVAAWLRINPWIVVAVAAALAVLLLGVVLALDSRGSAPPAAATSTPRTPEPDPVTIESVLVSAEDYLGLTYEQAEAQLRSKGMRVQRRFSDGDGEVGTVVRVDPVGPWPQGSVIALTVVASPSDDRDGEGTSDEEPEPDDEEVTGEPEPGEQCEGGKRDKPRGRDRDRQCL